MAFEKVTQTHEYNINGLAVRTGDLVCTTDGDPAFLRGQIWRLIGKIIPGEVDHIVIYTGPGGRCVEAGAKRKVIEFNVPGNGWDTDAMYDDRGGLIDTLYGIADPVAGQGLSPEEQSRIRIDVANYCVEQAERQKPYNIWFNLSDTEEAFYCSQLAYKAYLRHGINMNTSRGIPGIPFTESVVLPQELWDECRVKTRA
ncbi:MAG: YiiX/YebB-like N1pC/P60 family cysteine hydrolase [Nitrospinota bacterium]|nr:YiiX/YebB-like N1pC/P60 family cysteine hydrolase [Nitrospinota bacterium]